MVYPSKIQHFFLVLFLTIAQVCLAQKPWKLQWGKPHTIEKKSGGASGFVATGPEGHYLLKRKTQTSYFDKKPEAAWLELYGHDLGLVKSIPLPLKYKDEQLMFERFAMMKDKAYLITSFYNNKLGKRYMFAQPINLKSSVHEAEYTTILEVDLTSLLRPNGFGLALSPDGSRILAYGALMSQEGQEERYSLAVMDADMKQSWRKDIELPYPQKSITVREFRVDNIGNVHILATRKRSKGEKKERDEYDRDYYIFTYRSGDAAFVEHKAQLEQKHISGFKFRPTNTGDLVCAGYYSDEEEGQVKGAFFYKISGQDGRELEKNIQAFNQEVLISDLSKRKQEKAKKKKEDPDQELGNYIPRNLEFLEDGSIILVGEHFYVTETSYSSGNSGRMYPVNHYHDLLVTRFAPDGKLGWAAKVEKKQGEGNKGYAMKLLGDKLYFIYKNDLPLNEGVKIATLSAANGEVSYSPLYDDDGALDHQAVFSPSPSKLIIGIEEKKNYRLLELDFK